MNKIKIFFALCIVNCALLIGTAGAQDFGIYDLSAKTNLDSTDILMLSQASDSTYYKVYFDRIVDSVEDSIRGAIIDSWVKSGAAIALNKLASGTAAYFIVNNGSGVPTYVAMSGDATLSNAGAVTIASNAIGSTEITDGSIVNADVNASAGIVYSKLTLTNSVVSADITDGTITGTDIADESVTTLDIDDGTIANADISASAAIALSKLATGTAAYIIVNNGSGVPTYVAMSGDATISNAGVVDLAEALADNFIFSGSLNFNGTIASTIDSLGSGISEVPVTAPVIILYENGGGTNVTSISGGSHGTEVELIAHPSNSENIQITDNASINLAGGASWTTMGANDVIRLRNYWGVWIETYRSNN